MYLPTAFRAAARDENLKDSDDDDSEDEDSEDQDTGSEGSRTKTREADTQKTRCLKAGTMIPIRALTAMAQKPGF